MSKRTTEKKLPSDRHTFEAITFDLFGTLVQLDERRLPQLNMDGATLPSILAAPLIRLHELLPSVNLGDVLVSYFQAGTALLQPGARRDQEVQPWAHFAECLERIGQENEALARELAQSQMEATLKAARPVQGALLLLASLRQRGCKLGLVSNFTDGHYGRALLSQLKMDSYFDAVVFSGDVGWRKPHRRIFQTVLSAFQMNASEVLHIGDELRADIWGAGHCGMSTVWVNPGRETFAGDHPPRLQIRCLAALADAGLTLERK